MKTVWLAFTVEANEGIQETHVFSSYTAATAYKDRTPVEAPWVWIEIEAYEVEE